MSNYPEDIFAKCPYYRYDSEGCIFCEGISETSTLRLSFHNPKARRQHKHDFCRNCWTGCAIAQMQNRRYSYSPN